MPNQVWEGCLLYTSKGLEKQERLEAYCSKGIKALLRACPEIDNVHFRVNHESGVGGRDSAEAYWLAQIDAVGEAAREAAEGGRRFTLELRAKGMTCLLYTSRHCAASKYAFSFLPSRSSQL